MPTLTWKHRSCICITHATWGNRKSRNDFWQTKKQHICSLTKMFNILIFHQNLDFPVFMAKASRVWQKRVVWSGWKSSSSYGERGFSISKCQIFITFNVHADDVDLEVQLLYVQRLNMSHSNSSVKAACVSAAKWTQNISKYWSVTPICSDSCITYASVHIFVQSMCLCSFIYTVLNVIAAAVCICLTAKACFFHLLRAMRGCPNMKMCRQTGNSYGLLSTNNTILARSDTCVVILGKTVRLIKLALYWPGTGNTNFITDMSALVTLKATWS